MSYVWSTQLIDLVDWHWHHQLRPRLDGLRNDEYFREPVAGCWNIRPRGTSSAPIQAGSGAFTMDLADPQPAPPPVTTISWRLCHVLVFVLGARIARHFDGPPIDYLTYDYPGSAPEAMSRLDRMYEQWLAGVRRWDDDALLEPVGDAEPQFSTQPRAALVLHINRELIHHGAEISLLRDLYAHQ